MKKEKNQLTNSNRNLKNLSKLEKKHFKKRIEAEEKFFGKKNINFKVDNIFKISKDNLIDGTLLKIIKKQKSENLITYGCHKIDKKILKVIKGNKWNVHAGLSPWYRGSMTHFWPSYLLEPEFTGMTLHKLTDNIDGGDIIHQSVVNLNPKDGIHENACRCLGDFLIELKAYFPKNYFRKTFKGINQVSSGRLWTSKMWHPNLLKIVYEKFDDKINKFCIENKKKINKPKINSILKEI